MNQYEEFEYLFRVHKDNVSVITLLSYHHYYDIQYDCKSLRKVRHFELLFNENTFKNRRHSLTLVSGLLLL